MQPTRLSQDSVEQTKTNLAVGRSVDGWSSHAIVSLRQLAIRSRSYSVCKLKPSLPPSTFSLLL